MPTSHPTLLSTLKTRKTHTSLVMSTFPSATYPKMGAWSGIQKFSQILYQQLTEQSLRLFFPRVVFMYVFSFLCIVAAASFTFECLCLPLSITKITHRIAVRYMMSSVSPDVTYAFDSFRNNLVTFEDFITAPIKCLENGGRSKRRSGGVCSSMSGIFYSWWLISTTDA